MLYLNLRTRQLLLRTTTSTKYFSIAGNPLLLISSISDIMSGQGAFPRRKVVAAVAAEVQQNNSVGRLLLPTRKAGAKADAKDAQQKRRKEPQQKRTFEKFEDPNAARKAAAAAEGHGGETRNLLEVGAAGQRPKNRISLKNLKEGTTLIGSVTKIQTHELVFDLPYGLVGVCKKDQCYEGDDNARLDELFRVGQVLLKIYKKLLIFISPLQVGTFMKKLKTFAFISCFPAWCGVWGRSRGSI